MASGARLKPAAAEAGVDVRTVQRWRAQGVGDDRRQGPHREPANKLRDVERKRVLEVANSPEYRDLSPKQIVPKLADEGDYIASESTFYRCLRAADQLHHRERSAPAVSRRPAELVATEPEQVWSWDITYLRSSVRGEFYYLYMVEDVWSRKIVGWEVHAVESMDLASALIERTCAELGVDPEGLTLHSDNGGPMKGSTMLATLQRLGIVPSFSRPHVSDDNPFSEALFRTLKYRPEYPRKPFQSLEEARKWVTWFVDWYNTEHLHSAIGFVTPDDRHHGRDIAILAQRHAVYQRAQRRHPERWTGPTRNWIAPAVVRLNPHQPESVA